MRSMAQDIVDEKAAQGGTVTIVGTKGFLRDVQAVMTREELEGVEWVVKPWKPNG